MGLGDLLSQLGWILYKDLLIAWRGRARQVGLLAYGLGLLLLFSVAVGPDGAALRAHAAAYLWLTALSASTLLLSQSFQSETETGGLEGLLLVPVSPLALFYGKALANLVALLVLVAFSLPAVVLLFDLGPPASVPRLTATLLLGCAGIVAPGTLYAALTARLQARSILLPVLLFPLVLPPVLAAVQVTGLLFLGDPMRQQGPWLALLTSFNLIYWSLSGVLFGKLLEE
jgi:heme exporter protein B